MSDLTSTDMISDLKCQAELINAWMRTFYGDKLPLRPELIETHVSWVVLTGEKAYKIKKAIKLDFLDFSDLPARRFYCEEEIRLNKRTAPEIYRQVIFLGGNISEPRMNAEPVLEYAVEMKRFPRKNEMSRMLQDNRLRAFHIDSLAEKIAHFHQNLPSVANAPANTAYGAYDFIFHGLKRNYDVLRALFSDSGLTAELKKLDALEALHFAALKEKKDMIKQRRHDGFVRECHGDLHMGNVVVIDGDAILFDSIEFAPDFRCIDVMCDLAFAFMDLHHFGRPDYAWRLLNRYLEETGDYEGARLLDIFGASHAIVRAKVTAIRCLQLAKETERPACLEESRSYMVLARDMLRDRSSGMLITCGLPGAGKSVFSLAALGKTGAIRIRSDIERKRHYGLEPLQSSSDAAINIYSKEASEITYSILEKLADMLLAAGFKVIVDAAFLEKTERERFCRFAASRSVPYVIAMVSASPETLLKRVAARQAQHDDSSEAGPAVLAKKQMLFEPLSSEEQSYAIEIINEDGHDFESDKTCWESLKQKLSAT